MPGAKMKCLNTVQPILGLDWHLSLPPVPPAHAPHLVIWGEGWSQYSALMWSVSTSKASSPQSGVAKPVVSDWGYAVAIDHDAGPHLGHIWLNALLPLVALGSSSKSKFASGTVKTPQGYMAIAVCYVVNINLDCHDFPLPPLPTGLVIAGFATVHAGFTFGDFLRGLLSMIIDMAITWIIGLITAGVISALQSIPGAFMRGLRGGFASAFHGQGFWGAFFRGAGRGFWQGFTGRMAQALTINFVTGLSPGALTRALGNLFQAGGRGFRGGFLGSTRGGQGFWGAFNRGASRAIVNGAAGETLGSLTQILKDGFRPVFTPAGLQALAGQYAADGFGKWFNINVTGGPMGYADDGAFYSWFSNDVFNQTDWCMQLGRSMSEPPAPTP